MKFRLIAVVMALGLTPGLALAGPGCSNGMRPDETAATCLQGFVWDSGTGTCVEITTG
jgi:hypothetical protein